MRKLWKIVLMILGFLVLYVNPADLAEANSGEYKERKCSNI